MEQQQLPTRRVQRVDITDSVMIFDAIDLYLPPLSSYHTLSRNLLTRNHNRNVSSSAYVDGHQIFDVVNNINQLSNQVQSSTRNVETNQRQHFYRNLPRIKVTEAMTCSVCLVEFLVGSKAIQLPCSHIYHDECIMSWFDRSKNTCPMCRRLVSDVSL
ncbi:hypothetical protein TSUD_366760 [Trifolium subterraneum]|uniref:RING-type domain-containing protein n=1 Tax=Trifolium subterraneum TaxID=3900 RepID=A0A2Z6M8Q7_TRISU|nr:hypothetical protein TSUD_366760 [Trifolium subterraneum]